MKVFKYLILIAAFTLKLYPQSLPYYFTPESEYGFEKKSVFNEMAELEKGKYDHLNSAIIKKPYDVLTYEIYLDWYDMLMAKGTSTADRVWRGSNKITLRIDSANVKTIAFDAVNLKIQSVTVNRINITPVPQPVNGKLKITLPYTYPVGEELGVTINYQYTAVQADLGFYLYPEKMYIGMIAGTSDSVFVESRLAYTMSEPEDARYWMPCNDQPDDKAIATISVRVPKDYFAVSNGLISKIDDMDTYQIFTWKENSPITTYLMAVTASKFVTFSDWYKKQNNPKDSIEIQYYVWKKDFDATKTDGTQYNAHRTLTVTPQAMNAFSSRFIEYPFDKYGMVAIMPFSFGGMEHQTITSINRVWMRTNDHFGIAHELGHQWIGDLITCATWKDVWINEGGATWTEGIWAEHLWGKDAYMNHLVGKRNGYLRSGGLSLPPIYDLPISSIFANYATLVYEKASWVYHQLRTMLGDSVYYPAFRSMLTKYAGKSLETEDFANHFIEEVPNPPFPLSEFFDQWLMKAGHPVFETDITYSKKGPDYNANITLSQTQTGTNVPFVFKLPVRLMFWGAGGTKTLDTLLCVERIQNFNVLLPYLPDSVKIDTSFSLLESKKIITSVKEIKKDDFSPEFRVQPNPSNGDGEASVNAHIGFPEMISVELFDNLGAKVKDIYSGYLDEGYYRFSFDSSLLASGAYKVVLKNGSKTLTTPFILVK